MHRREVRLTSAVLAGRRSDQLLCFGEVQGGDLRGDDGRPALDDGREVRHALLDRREHAGDHVPQDRHHVSVIADEAELGVERDVLGEMSRGVVRLGTEHRSDLVHALEDANHDLLVELRALSEIRGAAEVVEAEDVRTALGRGLDDLGGLDLDELAGIEGGAEAGDCGGRDAEDALAPRVAQRDGRVIELGGQRGAELRAVEVERWRRDRRRQDRHLRVDDLCSSRRGRVRDHAAPDLQHALLDEAGELSRLRQVRDDDLRQAGRVAQDEERHGLELALAVQPAFEQHGLAGVLCQVHGQDPVGTHVRSPYRR